MSKLTTFQNITIRTLQYSLQFLRDGEKWEYYKHFRCHATFQTQLDLIIFFKHFAILENNPLSLNI